MTAPAIKPERKRLHRSDQTGVEQTKNRINPASGTRSHPQVIWQVLLSRHSRPNRFDLAPKQRQNAREGILLGEYRFKGVSQSRSRFGVNHVNIHILGGCFKAWASRLDVPGVADCGVLGWRGHANQNGSCLFQPTSEIVAPFCWNGGPSQYFGVRAAM